MVSEKLNYYKVLRDIYIIKVTILDTRKLKEAEEKYKREN